MADAAAWRKVRKARRAGRRRSIRMAETRPGSWCELAESPWEGLNHRKGRAKRRTLGNTRRRNMGTEKEKLC